MYVLVNITNCFLHRLAIFLLRDVGKVAIDCHPFDQAIVVKYNAEADSLSDNSEKQQNFDSEKSLQKLYVTFLMLSVQFCSEPCFV